MNIKKLLGHRYDTRYSWGELSFKKKNLFCGSSTGIKLSHDTSSGGKNLSIYFLWVRLLIYLNKNEVHYFNDESYRWYGFYLYDGIELVVGFAKWSKTIYLPWMYEWKSTELLDFDKKTVLYKETKTNRIDSGLRHDFKKVVARVANYSYVRNNGETQHRQAFYHVERWTWAMRWFPFIEKVKTSVEVTFDKEIGEGVDSWKGGCVSCAYEIKDNETPLQCLRRMENERKFKR